MRSRGLLLMVLFLCVLAGGVVFSGASALAFRGHAFGGVFGSAGAGVGQFSGPAGVAVNSATGDVYVVDRGNDRVEEFDSTGTTVLATFNGAPAPTGAFIEPEGITVDNSTNPLDPSAGDVYVADVGHNVVDKFTATGVYQGQLTAGAGGAAFTGVYGVAVDQNGVVWVYQETGEIDNYSDALTNQFIASRESPFRTSPGFAVDTNENLYVNRGDHEIGEIESNGTLLMYALEEGVTSTAVAVDLSDNEVFVDNESSVAAFDTTSEHGVSRPIESFGSGQLTGGSGIAVNSVTKTVYVADAAADVVDIFTATPEALTGAASNATETSATLNGTVNPGGQPVTSCEFEYGTSEAYGASVPCAQSAGEIGSGTGPVAVSADVSGLEPRTIYHFRLIAANTSGPNTGLDRSFATPAQPVVADESIADVASDSVTFQVQVNPSGLDTTYRFEYVPATAYNPGAANPYAAGAVTASGDAGSDVAVVALSAHQQGLAPETTYHYRVLAGNALGSVPGPDRVFTTQPSGGVFSLPEGRAFELVTPPDKHGAEPAPIDGYSGGGVVQASPDGNAITYLTLAPIVPDPQGNANGSQILSTRGPGGWSSQDIAPPTRSITGGLTDGSQFTAFSLDLSHGAISLTEAEVHPPDLAPGALAGYRNVYVRGNANGSFKALVTHPLYEENPETTEAFRPEFRGASPDLRHIVISTSAALTPGSLHSNDNLYEWDGSGLQAVNVLPGVSGGVTTTEHDVFLGGGFGGGHAVSDDGSRVFWSFFATTGAYMRDTVTQTTVSIPVPLFEDASADGSMVFGGGSLYDVETGTSTDVTNGVGGYLGMLGASEDLSYIYFVSNGVQAQGASPGSCPTGAGSSNEGPGTCNLYVWHAGQVRFIASLSQNDKAGAPHVPGGELGAAGDWSPALAQRTARVAGDGRHVVFMSQASLTGYDNRDARTGLPDQEVYVYDAESGQLSCASCNPTGARPTGPSGIPGGTDYGVGEAGYQSRVLSEDGSRVFFDSADGLVPLDQNGVEDVYEYVGGRAYLISGGQSSQPSSFLDASADGSSVFFLSAARLVPQDIEGGLEVYDARVCTPGDPCVAPPGAVAPPCTSSDGCKGGFAPQPLAFGAPASSTFAGAGNLAPPVSKAPVKKHGKRTVKKKKRKVRGRSRTRAKAGRTGVRSMKGRR